MGLSICLLAQLGAASRNPCTNVPCTDVPGGPPPHGPHPVRSFTRHGRPAHSTSGTLPASCSSSWSTASSLSPPSATSQPASSPPQLYLLTQVRAATLPAALVRSHLPKHLLAASINALVTCACSLLPVERSEQRACHRLVLNHLAGSQQSHYHHRICHCHPCGEPMLPQAWHHACQEGGQAHGARMVPSVHPGSSRLLPEQPALWTTTHDAF